MMRIFYWAFVVCSAVFVAYTQQFQAAILYWGKKIAPDNEYLPTGLQDAITPRSQTIRNIIMLILFIGSAVSGFLLFRWYMVLAGPVALFFFGAFISGGMLPKPYSIIFKRKIMKDLMRRLIIYQDKSDERRILATEEIIHRLDDADSDGDLPAQ